MSDNKLCMLCAGCQRCEDALTAISWCSDCSELVCNACSRVHENKSPPHKVVAVKEMQKLSTSLLTLSENCDYHPDQAISLYCCQHDKVACISCVPVSHHNCKSIISIEKAAKGVKNGTAISDLERRLSNLCQVTENRRNQGETISVDFEENRTNIKKRVSEIKQKVIDHLDRLEAEIHKDIDFKYTTCTEMMSRKRNSVQTSVNSLSTWKSDIKSLKQHSSETHLFQVVKFLDAKIYQKELEIREIRTATVPILKYHSSEFESNIQKLVPDLGTITIENVQVPMPVLDIDQQCQNLVRDERKLALSNSFKTSKLGNGVRILSSCLISDGRLLLSPTMGKQLIVCTLDGSNSKVIGLDNLPLNISLYDKNYAVVSVGDAGIQIIDLISLKPGRKIKVKGSCKGITSVKGKIWVKNKPHTITIMDINDKVLNIIQTTFEPCDICANKYGDVYCTDMNSDKVYVVTSDGKEREIFNSPFIKNAIGVSVDNRGDVYVAGYISHNIHRISYDGQKHEIVLTRNDGINKPTGLSYNKETKELLVLNEFDQSINIYKTQ